MLTRLGIVLAWMATLVVTTAAGCGQTGTATATSTPTASRLPVETSSTPEATSVATPTATTPATPTPTYTATPALGCPAVSDSAATAPAGRIGAAMSYDPITRRMLLFSGVTWDGPPCPNGALGNRIFNDMWSFDGTAWTQLHPPALPPGRSHGVMAYDEAHRTTLLMGGGDPNSDPFRDDIWAWAGGTWTELHPSVNPLTVAMAYDTASGSLLSFSPSLFAWNGTTWVDQHPAHLPPGSGPFAYDAVTRKLVVLVESQGQEVSTWTWNGVDFQQEHPVHQPPNWPASVGAYDAARGVVVAFVGGETWTWNGSDWIQQHPPVSPMPRYFAPMIYDPAIGKLLLFGGKVDTTSGATLNNQLWGWDGTTWTLLA